MDNQPQPFQLPVIQGRVFKGETVTLDGFWYDQCEFIGCTLIFRGSHSNCTRSKIHADTVWQFEGDVARMVQVLQDFGWRFEFGNGPHPEPIRFPSDAV